MEAGHPWCQLGDPILEQHKNLSPNGSIKTPLYRLIELRLTFGYLPGWVFLFSYMASIQIAQHSLTCLVTHLYKLSTKKFVNIVNALPAMTVLPTWKMKMIAWTEDFHLSSVVH